MALLELTEGEMNSLKTVLEQHINPCDDCSPDLNCRVYECGLCITKNVENILLKIREITI